MTGGSFNLKNKSLVGRDSIRNSNWNYNSEFTVHGQEMDLAVSWVIGFRENLICLLILLALLFGNALALLGGVCFAMSFCGWHVRCMWWWKREFGLSKLFF